ncbi:LuxR C-terminal-related transcriptional regulator [Geminicoccaceae bacterium 1502E]|nr:LuxR C-terminal-related transcriptional regulator [Geminicoccaceae bacterium 1502E]
MSGAGTPPVVLLHGAAGEQGLKAMVAGLPRHSGAAFVLVPAEGPGSVPAELLAAAPLPVVPLDRHAPLLADTLHLPPPDMAAGREEGSGVAATAEPLDALLAPLLARMPPGETVLVSAGRHGLPEILRRRLKERGVTVVSWWEGAAADAGGRALEAGGSWERIGRMLPGTARHRETRPTARSGLGPFARSDALEALVLLLGPALFREEGGRRPLRLWLPAAGDGAGAYALAILLAERREALGVPARPVHILAGVSGERELAAARDGLYPHAALEGMPTGRLARFFLAEPSGWRAAPALRAMVLPASQEALSASVLPPMDAILCVTQQGDAAAGGRLPSPARLAAALADDGLLLLGQVPRAGLPVPGLLPVGGVPGLFRRPGRAVAEQPEPPAARKGLEIELELLSERLDQVAGAHAAGALSLLADRLGAGDVALLLLGPDLAVRYASPAARRLLGAAATAGAEAGWPWNEPGQQAALRTALAGGEALRRLLRAPDGRHWRCAIEPLEDGEGQIAGLTVSLADVTDQERSRQTALTRLGLLRAVLLAAGVGYLVLDESWRVVEADASFLRRVGLPDVDPAGRYLADLPLAGIDASRIRALWETSGGAATFRVPGTGGEPVLLAARAIDALPGLPGRLLVLTAAPPGSAEVPGGAVEQVRGPLQATCGELQRTVELLGLLEATLARQLVMRRPLETVRGLGLAVERMRGAVAGLGVSAAEEGVARLGPVPLGPVLERLHWKMAELAASKGLTLRTVGSSAEVFSEATLLEECLRALLAHLVVRAPRRRIVVGCRRRGGRLRVELWAESIPADRPAAAPGDAPRQPGEPEAAARLARRLGHEMAVRATARGGLMASLELMQVEAPTAAAPVAPRHNGSPGLILLAEPDPELRAALRGLLDAFGYRIREAAGPEGGGGMALAGPGSGGGERPCLVIAAVRGGDAEAAAAVRRMRRTAGPDVPVLVLAEDPAADACVEGDRVLVRPVRPELLLDAVAETAAPSHAGQVRPEAVPRTPKGQPPVFLVAGDADRRAALAGVLVARGLEVAAFAAPDGLLAALEDDAYGCILMVADKAAGDGLELVARLRDRLDRLAVVLVARRGDVPFAVRAMRAGACDVLQMPAEAGELVACVERGLALAASAVAEKAQQQDLTGRLAQLSDRERQILAFVTAGLPNKEIAFRLGISRRTVENHRARIMQKMKARSLAELVRQSAGLGL